MKIYTKTGDDGTTGLFNGERVKKYAERVDLYGTVDELNSVIGVAVASGLNDKLKEDIFKIQNLLFNLGSDLATPLNPPPKFEVPRIKNEEIEFLEGLIDKYDLELPPLKSFILPGGTHASAHLHQARTVCRRAERMAVYLAEKVDIGNNAIKFLNRLSDYLFTAARYANKLENFDDITWKK